MSSTLSSRLRWRPPETRVAPSPRAAPADLAAAPAGPAAVPVGHDPELSPRDEAVYLLHVAAEVEHALLVQYLYAAFSLRRSGLPPAQQAQVSGWRGTIFQIAKEEMAHLLAVQNVLRFLGGPVTLAREDFPFRSDVYPFHFRLEPLTKDVLAKYIFAESSPAADYHEKVDVRKRAALSDPSDPFNHVGAIYEAIVQRIRALTPADFRADDESMGYQASPVDWAFRRPPGPGDPHIVDPNMLLAVVPSQDEAVGLLNRIAEQGEAAEDPNPAPGLDPSHFARFLEIFRAFPEGAWVPTDPVPKSPNTSPGPAGDREQGAGRISHPLARRWAQLFNTRYRMLLVDLLHLLHLGSDTETLGGATRSTLRPQLRGMALAEMGNLAEISERLAGLPLRAARSGGFVAGPPFELPYTLDLPLLELDRWRLHRDLGGDTALLAGQIRTPPAREKRFAEHEAAALALLA